MEPPKSIRLEYVHRTCATSIENVDGIVVLGHSDRKSAPGRLFVDKNRNASQEMKA